MGNLQRVVAGSACGLGLALGSCNTVVYEPPVDFGAQTINPGIYRGRSTCEPLIVFEGAERVISSSGLPIFNGREIREGQVVSRSLGGAQVRVRYTDVELFNGGFSYCSEGEGLVVSGGESVEMRSEICESCEQIDSRSIYCVTEGSITFYASGESYSQDLSCTLTLSK